MVGQTGPLSLRKWKVNSSTGEDGAIPKKRGAHASNLVPPIEFWESEWARITRTVALPSDARLRIGAALAWFASERRADTTSQKSKRTVEKARRYVCKLDAALREILQDEVFFSAGQPHWSSRPRPNKREVEQALSALQQLDTLLVDATPRMTMKPGRKSMQSIDFLIEHLNQIQGAVSGDYLKQSTNRDTAAEFVVLCCEKVGLTRGQVLRSIKRRAANSHRVLTNDQFDITVGKYVRDDGHVPKSRRSRATHDGAWRIRRKDVRAFLKRKKKKSSASV